MNKLTTSMLLVFLGLALSKATGFLREISYSSQFGASAAMDSYLVAFLIPSLIANIVAATVPPIFVPEYLTFQKKKTQGTNRTLNLFITYIFSFVILFIVLILIFSEMIGNWFVSGFNAEMQIQTIHLIRLLVPYAFCTSAIILINTLLQANRKVFLSSFIQVPVNLTTIIFVLLFSEKMGVSSIAAALYVSFILQMILLIMTLKKIRFRYMLQWKSSKQELLHLWKLVFPPVISSLLYYGYAITERILGSHLEEGSISYLAYAYKAVELPMSVVSIMISAVMYPLLSKLYVDQQASVFNQKLIRFVRLIFYGMLPLAVNCYIFNKEIVGILYVRGAFDLVDAGKTSSAMMIYTFIMIPMLLKELFNFAFFAKKNMTTPLKFTALEVLVYMMLAFLFHFTFHDYRWLAIAFTMAITIQALGLGYKSVRENNIPISITRVLKEISIILLLLVVSSLIGKIIYHYVFSA